MSGVVFDAFTAPLGYGTAIEVVLPDGLDVVGAEVVEADLTVRLHYVADPMASRMKRKVACAPQGVVAHGVKHLHTVLRFGAAFHYVIEE